MYDLLTPCSRLVIGCICQVVSDLMLLGNYNMRLFFSSYSEMCVFKEPRG